MGIVSHTLTFRFETKPNQCHRHRDLHWNEFPNRINLNERVTQRTGPKPDLTYAFPIIDTSKAPKSVDQFDPQVKAFSLRVLNHLRNSERAKLRSAPTTSLKRYDEKQKNSELGDEHLTCFPWAIVEVKRSEPDKPSETFCYCQAANASAEALVLREELAQKAKDAAQTHDAMVIFAFTCIGPSVKLWVTYREQVSRYGPQTPSKNRHYSHKALENPTHHNALYLGNIARIHMGCSRTAHDRPQYARMDLLESQMRHLKMGAQDLRRLVTAFCPFARRRCSPAAKKSRVVRRRQCSQDTRPLSCASDAVARENSTSIRWAAAATDSVLAQPFAKRAARS